MAGGLGRTVEMSCTIGRKVNDGNYGSMEVVAGEKIVLIEGDDPAQAYEAMRQRVLGLVFQQLSEWGIRKA